MLSAARLIEIDEIVGAHPLLAFDLQFPDLEGRTLREAHQQTIAIDCEVPCQGDTKCENRYCRVDVQHLAPKAGKRSRPWLKSAQAVPGIRRAAGEINESVFPLEEGSERGLGIVLRMRRYGSVLQAGQGCDHELGAGLCQPRSQGERSIFRRDPFFR